MRSLPRSIVLTVLLGPVALSGAGCGGGDRAEGAEISRDVIRPPRPRGKALYGAKGELVESDVKVGPLPLPRGFEQGSEIQGEHVHRASLPVEKVSNYFTARLDSDHIEHRTDGGVRIRRGKYKGSDGEKDPLFDVRVSQERGGVRVGIMPIAVDVKPTMSEAQALEWARKEWTKGR